MMTWESPLFLLALTLLVYTWAGYPALLWLLRRLFARRVMCDDLKPSVSIVVAAHNEEERIAGKLRDCLEIDYPRDRLEILVVSDSSTDATDQVVRQFAGSVPCVRLLRSEGRVGKSGAQNVAAREARNEILFLTDANTRMSQNVLVLLMRNFADARVGLVTATVRLGEPSASVAKGQGLYWRYELFLREAESDLGILATGSGQAMAMRRELYRPLLPCFGDDCILPLDVRLQGYRVLHDSSAVVFDTMPHTIDGELRARMRMTTRNWTGTLSCPALLNPFRFPMTALGLLSHKLLRWLTPFLLATVFITNSCLMVRDQYVGLWLVQVVFYLSAIIGWTRERKSQPAGVFAYPFSFCLANFGFLLGLMKAFRSQRIVAY